MRKKLRTKRGTSMHEYVCATANAVTNTHKHALRHASRSHFLWNKNFFEITMGEVSPYVFSMVLPYTFLVSCCHARRKNS